MWMLFGSNTYGRRVYLASFSSPLSADSAWELMRRLPDKVVWYNGLDVYRDTLEILFVPLWLDSKVGKHG